MQANKTKCKAVERSLEARKSFSSVLVSEKFSQAESEM